MYAASDCQCSSTTFSDVLDSYPRRFIELAYMLKRMAGSVFLKSLNHIIVETVGLKRVGFR